MQLVTLTTDWGYSDFFAGMVKGRLYSLIPDVQVVDITHGVEPFSKNRATFVVRNACMCFPHGTIHIIDVDSYETRNNPFLVIRYDGQYFICADNGIPSAVFYGKGDEIEIYQLSLFQDSNFFTFASYNLFCFAAEHIALGRPLEDIGYKRSALAPYTPMGNSGYDNRVEVMVAYIDSYGNAYLNLKYDEFETIRHGRKLSIRLDSYTKKPIKLSLGYTDSVDSGEGGMVMTVSATGYLQIAMLHTSAERLLGLKVGRKVTVFFE